MKFTPVLLLAICVGIGSAAIPNTTPVPEKALIPLLPGEKCPITTCARNEVLRPCGLCYHNTCNGTQDVQPCKAMCYCGCYCKIGYVRVNKTGPCILPKQCPTLEMI